MNALTGLPAQIRADCRVLVMGSMPGTRSLEQARYYAHPRNRFWPLMGILCGIDPQAGYPERLAQLQQAGVGLWDVLARCQRQGSLDAAIRRDSIEVVPLLPLLDHLPQLTLIACNGATASQLFQRHLWPWLHQARPALAWLALPSTSPANAGWSLDRLQASWSSIVPALPG